MVPSPVLLEWVVCESGWALGFACMDACTQDANGAPSIRASLSKIIGCMHVSSKGLQDHCSIVKSGGLHSQSNCLSQPCR